MTDDFHKSVHVMGISRMLKQGRLHLNTILNRIEIDYKDGIFIPYLEITPSDWGLVYEKYVGQAIIEHRIKLNWMFGKSRWSFDIIKIT